MNDISIFSDAVKEIKNAILQSRYRIAASSNIELLTLYYNVGRYISDNTRVGKWGSGAIETISERLQGELRGIRGFSATNMKNMRVFYEKWSPVLEQNRQLQTAESVNKEIYLENRQLPTADLTGQELESFIRVGFTHHREILREASSLEERWYYIHRSASEFWDVMSLKSHLKNKDFLVFGKLPNNFSLTISDAKTAERAVWSFKDEYLLDYIHFENQEKYDEEDVQDAIVLNIRKFIMTCGKGFCFVGDKYRVIIGDDEFFIDLLFFNRDLQCLVAFELKRGKFTPADLGQLNFYLSALDKHVRRAHENSSVGIILCKEMNRAVVELAIQDYNKPVGVATYRIGNDMPERYKSLVPVIDGVQQILQESDGI